MFGDLDWSLTASRGFDRISWAVLCIGLFIWNSWPSFFIINFMQNNKIMSCIFTYRCLCTRMITYFCRQKWNTYRRPTLRSNLDSEPLFSAHFLRRGCFGADLCSTLGRRADDLCPGRGACPIGAGVGAAGSHPLQLRGPRVLPPRKFGYFA